MTNPVQLTQVGPSRWAVFAVATAAVTAYASYAAGIVALAVSVIAVTVAWGRGSAWRWARALDRPRVFTGLALAYLPFFGFDLLISAQTGQPIPALTRLVAFLLLVEAATGDPRSDLRLLLLGLLLVIASAGTTTEIGFALGLAVFLVCAVVSRVKAVIVEHAATGRRSARDVRIRLRWIAALVVLQVVTALIVFFVTPHAGTGWGGARTFNPPGGSIATGLADNVQLGTIGLVKKNREIVLRARFRQPLDAPEDLYWRARVYGHWTGEGWRRGEVSDDRLRLAAGHPVELPTALNEFALGPTTTAEIRLVGRLLPAIPVPGTPRRLTSTRTSYIRAGRDGTLAPVGTHGPKHYEVEVELPGLRRAPGRRAVAYPADYYLSADSEYVTRWARTIGTSTSDPLELSRAFVRELASRSYSLDTRQIDPERPLESFLEGAAGHCEYFATSMALGLRSRGVPARVVGGYVGAEPVPFGDEYVVRESNAHLWVESFVPGRGWTVFDPTPPDGRAPAVSAWAGQRLVDATVLIWDTWIVGIDMDDQWRSLVNAVETLVAIARFVLVKPWTLMLAGTVALLALWFHRRRRTRRLALPSFYRHYLAILARRGLRWRDDETAEEFAQRAISQFGPSAAAAIESVTALYLDARFGGHEIDAERAREAVLAVRRLASV